LDAHAGYYLDFNTFSLEKFKNRLSSTSLPPSHHILLEDIDGRFTALESLGIENLAQLQAALKTKSKVRAISEQTDLPLDYLTVLRREVNSYYPKPVKLMDFPDVDLAIVGKLEGLGIMNSLQFFPLIITPESRAELATQQQIKPEQILELTQLTDLVRLKWVGPKFARLLQQSSYNTVEKIAQSDYRELYQELMRIKESVGIYKGLFGLEDMKRWVNIYVQDVPVVIQYKNLPVANWLSQP
jgi:hypothetical protein